MLWCHVSATIAVGAPLSDALPGPRVCEAGPNISRNGSCHGCRLCFGDGLLLLACFFVVVGKCRGEQAAAQFDQFLGLEGWVPTAEDLVECCLRN